MTMAPRRNPPLLEWRLASRQRAVFVSLVVIHVNGREVGGGIKTCIQKSENEDVETKKTMKIWLYRC